MPKFETYTQGTPCYAELLAGDLTAAKDFYAGVFGWGYDSPPDMEAIYASARVQGDRIAGLMVPPDGSPVPQAHWRTYLDVDDVDAVVAKVEPAGGTVTTAPFDVMTLGRAATVTDPTGAEISFWQPRDIIGTERANEPGTPCWNELITPDLATAAAFYTAVLGVEWEQQEMGGEDYWLLKSGGRPVAGAMSPSEPMPSQWSVYVNVEDVDATVARAEGLGAKPLMPAFDVPGVGRLGILVDPQGALFALMADEGQPA